MQLHRNRAHPMTFGLIRASFAVAVVLTTASVSTHAADLPVYNAAPPTPPVIGGWAGFYAGANAGGGWSNETTDPFNFYTFTGDTEVDPSCETTAPLCPKLTGVRGSGALYGGQFGYEWQPYARVVAGIEVDFDASTIKGSSTQTFDVVFGNTLQSKVRDLGGVRGKVGFLGWENILIYGTGGLAFGQVSNTFISTSNAVGLPATSFTYANTSTQFGWSAGGGADYKIGNLILGVLYLHYDLGLANQNLIANGGNNGFPTPSFNPFPLGLPNAHVSVDAVTARASWLFR